MNATLFLSLRGGFGRRSGTWQYRRTIALLLMVLFVLAVSAHAVVDESINKGVWRLQYGVTATQAADPTWLAQDSDGDGLTNQQELDAGTNPFDRNSCLRFTAFTPGATTIAASFPTVAQKLYVIQTTSSLTSPTWANLSPSIQVTGNGGTQNVTIPRSAGTYFRVLAQDIDADNDGVSDWAENILGLKATSTTSNGTLDTNGMPVTDSAYVTAQLAAQGKISISAVHASAEQPSTSGGTAPEVGTIRITRLGFPQYLPALTVNYTVTGTATSGTDYTAIATSQALTAHTVSQDITVTPLYNAARRDSVSTVLTLSASSNYTISGAGFAAVIIHPTTAALGTGLVGSYYDTSSTNYVDAANFGQAGTYSYTKNADGLTGTIVVTYTGAAISGITAGTQVKLSFTSGNLSTGGTYNNLIFGVTATGTNTFTVPISSSTALPTSGTGSLNFNIQTFTAPPTLQRLDANVNFDWGYGTPNGASIYPNNSPDNYSDTFEFYLSPSTAGAYQFQLDSDDKARVFIDLNGNGTFDAGEQIVEHNWDTPQAVGTFNQSAVVNLIVPATPSQRYKVRVEHVETTGDARCRLQWRLGTAAYANIPQGNMYSQTQAATYAFTKLTTTTGTATITLASHGLANGNQVVIDFTGSSLFGPTNYSGTYTVQNVSANTFDIPITGTAVPGNIAAGQGCILENRPNSPTTGVLNKTYANTTFTFPPGRVGVDAAVTAGNNGLWGAGTPDVTLINPDTFSVRWTGQVQPQFTEDYTYVVQADDGCLLKINGVVQPLRTAVSTYQGGSTYAYDGASGDVVVTYTNLCVVPNSYAVGETVHVDPTSGNLNHAVSATYTYDGTTGNTVVDYSALTNIQANGYQVGDVVQLDPTSGSINPYGVLPYTITAVTANTFTVNSGTGVYPSGSGAITIIDSLDYTITAATASTFTFHIGTGRYGATSGNINVEIMNKVLKDWSSMGNERYVRLPMEAGVRYDFQLDYYENTSYARCLLSWYSPSQPKQIIPTERLYPASGPLNGSELVSGDSGDAVVGSGFSYTVGASNGGTAAVSNLPSWLTYSGGVLSGTPPAGASGDYQVLITITGANGTSTSALNLHVDQANGSATREFWNGLTGTGVGVIPVNNPPSGTGTVTTLQDPTNFGDNYGDRIRGYITPPVDGNYYFWLAASDQAELWISNDADPVNKLLRASVTSGSTTPLNWAVAAKSPWLALEAGQKYYFEVLHKAGAGTGDNCAIGWLKPTDTGTAPSEVVPGTYLSRYYATPALADPGTFYAANMLGEGDTVTTNGVGASTLSLDPNETVGTISITSNGLSGTGVVTGRHIRSEPYLSNPGTILIDLNSPTTPGDGLQTNGTYKWTITGVGALTAADVREIIHEGKAYIDLDTATYPSGEIRGNYNLAKGSRTFDTPPAASSWTDDHTSNAGAVRFLTQATYGPNVGDIATLKGMASYSAWIDNQFTQTASTQLPEVLARQLSDAQGGGQLYEGLTYNSWWRNSVTGADQLRQRVALSLSEIMVVSATGALANRADALSFFYDTLAQNAFGNFRDILKAVTLTPAMGRYLDMLRNDKPDLASGRTSNENYAREVMQLFSIGLYRLWPDGTYVLDTNGNPVVTYSQQEVQGVAKVFTGWDYGYNGAFRTALGATTDWTRPMRETPARHFTGPKRTLNHVVLPGLASVGGQTLDPWATPNSTDFNDASFQALPGAELDAVIDELYNHPNTGPYICRQLIQRLVTSNPSPAYVYRVVSAFNDNGSGVRGDMKAVLKAILLDYEARSAATAGAPTFGKQKEPILRYASVGRAFREASGSGTYSQSGNHVITVAMPNKFQAGNAVFLEFQHGTFTPGDTTPSSEVYTVLTSPAPTTSSFSVNAKGWYNLTTTSSTGLNCVGTYSQTAGSNVLTITLASHYLPINARVWLNFPVASTGTALAGGIFTATSSTSTSDTVAGTTFTVTAPDTTARTGYVEMVRFTGSYTVTDSNVASPQNKRITLNTTYGGTAIANHHLVPGDHVWINFTGGNPEATDGEFVVESCPDANTFTVLTTGIGNVGNDSVYMFPLKSQPLSRTGNVGCPPSTFQMNNTNGDFDQSPLNSPSVFNFFSPGYRYPGVLAAEGMTTPEFQITNETAVMHGANFIFGGVFGLGNTNGISSFKSGSNAMVLDFSPWMANATDLGLGAGPQTAQPWTSNANLSTLITQMATLLTAGEISSTATSAIQSYLAGTISSVAVGNPCTITANAHNLQTGDTITIVGATGGSATINGTYVVTVTGANSFTIPVNVTTAPTSLASAYYSPVAYNDTTPSDTNKRDRLRAIIHFLLASPDFAIQR